MIWLIGLATIFLPLALCVMELSSRYPQEGGMYVWSKRAFGDFAGFLTGWIYWTSNLPYFPAVLYFAASNALYVGGNRWKGLQGSATFFIAFSLLGLATGAGAEHHWTRHRQVAEQPGRGRGVAADRPAVRCGCDCVEEVRLGDQLQLLRR